LDRTLEQRDAVDFAIVVEIDALPCPPVLGKTLCREMVDPSGERSVIGLETKDGLERSSQK
jgi:hypothetical protein